MHGPFEVVELRFPRVLEEKPVVYRSNSENCCERILLCTLLLVPSWKVQDFSLFVCLFVLVFLFCFVLFACLNKAVFLRVET